MGEPHGVRQEVEHDLFQAARVGDDIRQFLVE
jgi:hypothetical protein